MIRKKTAEDSIVYNVRAFHVSVIYCMLDSWHDFSNSCMHYILHE